MSVRYRSAAGKLSSASADNLSSAAGNESGISNELNIAGLVPTYKSRCINRDSIDESFIRTSLASLPFPPLHLILHNQIAKANVTSSSAVAIAGANSNASSAIATSSYNTSLNDAVYHCRLIRPVLLPPRDKCVPTIIHEYLTQAQQAMLFDQIEDSRKSLAAAQTLFSYPQIWTQLQQMQFDASNEQQWRDLIAQDQEMRVAYRTQELLKSNNQSQLPNSNRPSPIILSESEVETAEPDSASENVESKEAHASESTSVLNVPEPIPEVHPTIYLLYQVYFHLCQAELALNTDQLSNALMHAWQAWLVKEDWQNDQQQEIEQTRQQSESVHNRNSSVNTDNDHPSTATSTINNEYQFGQVKQNLSLAILQQLRSQHAHLANDSQIAASSRLSQLGNFATHLDWLIFQSLATAAFHLHDFHAALSAFWSSLALLKIVVAKNENESIETAALANNLGACLSSMGQCTTASHWFQAADTRYKSFISGNSSSKSNTSSLNASTIVTDCTARIATIKHNMDLIKMKRCGLEPSQMRLLMIGIEEACRVKDAEVEWARQNKSTKKGGKGAKNEAVVVTPVASVKAVKPLIASADLPFPPMRDLSQDVNFFQVSSMIQDASNKSVVEESKEQISPDASAAAEQQKIIVNAATAPLWLRAWNVMPNEYEKQLIASKAVTEGATTAKTTKNGKSKKGGKK